MLNVATGEMTHSPTGTLPLDASGLPGVAAPAAVQPGQLSGPTVPARDTQGEYAAPLAALEADCRAAQAAGMDARNAMLAHYHADILPQGTSYGDDLALPEVPEAATGPAGGFLYPWSGDEPVPAPAGLDYAGDEPKPA